MKRSPIAFFIIAACGYMLATSCGKNSSNPSPMPSTSGTVTTVAGPSFPSSAGSGLTASFALPYSVVADHQGNIYVADYGNNRIRKIAASGTVTTLAGTGTAGSANGPDSSATFNGPTGIAMDNSGNIYVAEFGNNMIRMISPAGVVSTVAGTGAKGSADGAAAAATFNRPTGIALDNSGNIYVGDQSNNKVRMISSAGLVSTLAGTGATGSTNGPGNIATFYEPTGVAVDNLGNIYVADYNNNLVRKINSSGVVSTFAGTGIPSFANGPGATASFSSPFGVTADASGNVYVADQGNNMIRLINSSGAVSTLAGSGLPGSLNGIGSSATFTLPSGVALDIAGNLYVADFDNNLIREISPSDSVTTLAGTGLEAFANSTLTASFNNPSGVAIDGQKNIYVADQGNNVIRKIDPTGVVTTLAGNGKAGSIDGPDSTASFFSPYGIAVDQKGNVYVSELDNKIRMISVAGMVSTLAGSGAIGGANGPGNVASFDQPAGIAVDMLGNIFVAEAGGNRIRLISPAGMVSTLAGSGFTGAADGLGAAAIFTHPTGVVVDAHENVYVADAGNNLIREISFPSGVTTTIAGSGLAVSYDATNRSAGFDDPVGITVDRNGNLYVTDKATNKIRYVTVGNTFTVTTLAGSGSVGASNGVGSAASFNQPVGVAEVFGELFVADMGNNMIRKVTTTN